jgi:purine-nucleoside phosphorylase
MPSRSPPVPPAPALSIAEVDDPRLTAARARVGSATNRAPDIGVVLGSGLGGFADSLDGAIRVPFTDVPHLPVPGVAGHSRALCLGDIGGARVACLTGRVHLYEGHPVQDVVFGVRLLAALGCGSVLVTNAAGGIRADLAPGSLMVVADHVNLTGQNPLVGRHRFVDFTNAYDAGLRAAARAAAGASGVSVSEGVYAGVLGPTYETPAEIRMLRAIGADAVGMSTVMEVIALHALGVRVGAVSCITNYAAGVTGAPLSHDEVEATAHRARHEFARFLSEWIPRCLPGREEP